jgi:hypothetical protein
MATDRARAPLRLETRIVAIRGRQVMLDADLASVYGVSTKVLNQAVKRNRARFPPDFVFTLSADDLRILRSQIVTSSAAHGGRRHRPRVFTEHGAIMAATVLRSAAAVKMSIFVVRAFTRLRAYAKSHAELASKLAELERTVGRHDERIRQMFQAIRSLLAPAARPHRQIGFRSPDV